MDTALAKNWPVDNLATAAGEGKSRRVSAVDKLPPVLARHRVVGTADAAAFCNMSIVHWRRLYRQGQAPPPLKISDRKLGWRIGDLVDWVATRKS